MELDGAPVTTAQLAALAIGNYGHFTTMRVEGGGVRGLSLHLRRLVDDCAALFDAELDPDRVRHLLRHALGHAADPVTVRVTVFDPALTRDRPGAPAHPRLLVSLRPAAPGPPPPLRVRSSVYCRETPAVKHVAVFGAVRQRREAQRAGFDDVLFIDGAGRVCEGATWNVGFCAGDQVRWPRGECLTGVTMRLLQGCEPTSTVPVTPADLSGVEAAFATNAGVGVRPIAGIDSYRWDARHPVVRRLAGRYGEIDPEPV
jgi:branched-subunit amino acid aminotransferase/4-amino-4-deoxychorismate lyase